MGTDQPKGPAFALADAFYAECQVVTRFIDETVRRPVDERANTTPGGIVFQTQLLRAIAWLHSLGKLNHPGDFQAVTAGARALFEGAVDVTLLHFDRAGHNPEKMDAWEKSAKVKHAQTIATYLRDEGRGPTSDEQTVLNFLQREQASVEQLRRRWWLPKKGTPKHPPRWTGRDLGSDAKLADSLHRAGFEEFYWLRYPQLCWNVHGSGAAGIAGVAADLFPFVGGRAYGEAAKFAVEIAEVVVRELECWNEADFTALRDQMKITSGLVYASY